MAVVVEWREPEPEVLDELTRWGCFAADSATISAMGRTSKIPNPDGSPQGLTGAELTEVGVRAALRMLLANGIVTAHLDGTVKTYALDPPPAS